MNSQLIVAGIVVVLVANLFSLSVHTNLANAKVICVDKYQYASIIPCSDQNAIDENSVKSSQLTPASTTEGTLTAKNTTTNVNTTGQVTCVVPTSTGSKHQYVPALCDDPAAAVLLPNGSISGDFGNQTSANTIRNITAAAAPINATTKSPNIMLGQGGMCAVDIMNATPVPCDQVQKQREINAGRFTVPLSINKTAGMNAATVPTDICAVLQSTQSDPQETTYVPASCSDHNAVNVSQIKGKYVINMTAPVAPNAATTNPAELNQIRNATLSKCEQTNSMKYCAQQELQLYGGTLEPGVRSLVQCETQHSMDYCFSKAGPVTGNNVRTSSSPHIFSHPSGHTAAYNQGFSDGTTSARNSGINDPGSACDSFGYKGTDCNHYLQGYADGFNSSCASSRFGCDGQGNPTLVPRSSNISGSSRATI